MLKVPIWAAFLLAFKASYYRGSNLPSVGVLAWIVVQRIVAGWFRSATAPWPCSWNGASRSSRRAC